MTVRTAWDPTRAKLAATLVLHNVSVKFAKNMRKAPFHPYDHMRPAGASRGTPRHAHLATLLVYAERPFDAYSSFMDGDPESGVAGSKRDPGSMT